MVYGYSGFGQTVAARGVSPAMRAAPSRGTAATTACARLKQKLASDAVADPVGLCTADLFVGTCAARQVEAQASPFRKQVRAEIATLFKAYGAAVASTLVYCAANMVSQSSDMSAQRALLYLRDDYLRTVGSHPLSQAQAAAQTGTTAIALPPGAVYGGTVSADTPTQVGPGAPAQTVAPPGPWQMPAPTADEDKAITAPPSDVYLPEGPPPSVPPPVNGGAGVPSAPPKKASVWPWVLGGAVLVGGGYYFYARKKRRG